MPREGGDGNGDPLDEQLTTVATGSGGPMIGARGVAVGVACVAVLAAVQLTTVGMPWDGPALAPAGVVGEAMHTSCAEVPRVGVSTSGERVVLDFTNPADGARVDQASALLAAHGVDAQFAVQPIEDEPVGRIMADGGIGDAVPVVDAGTIARAGGTPSDVSLPTSMRGSVWFTLACTPR